MSIRRTPARLGGAFTFMEVLIAIAIVALMVGVATPMYYKYLENAKVKTAKTQLKMLKQAVDSFKMDTSKTPGALEELMSNSRSLKGWDGPYLSGKKLPPDPWGSEFIFSVKSDGDYDIVSYGSDGSAGGTGKAEDLSCND